MNKTLKHLLPVLAAVLFCLPAPAQHQGRPDSGAWRDRLRNEKIAFITVEVGLTSSEAEKFWPVYNQIEQAQVKNVGKVGKCFFELQQAIDSGASEKVVEQKLRAYAKAQDEQRELEGVQFEKYSKILSMEKIARLYLAEEKFRRQQISRLHPPQAHR